MSRDSGYRNPNFSPLLGNAEQNNDWQFENPIIAVDLDTGKVISKQNLFDEGEITVEEKAKKRAESKIAIARKTLPKELLQAELGAGGKLKTIAELYGLELPLVVKLRTEYGLEYDYDRSRNFGKKAVAEPEPAPETKQEPEDDRLETEMMDAFEVADNPLGLAPAPAPLNKMDKKVNFYAGATDKWSIRAKEPTEPEPIAPPEPEKEQVIPLVEFPLALIEALERQAAILGPMPESDPEPDTEPECYCKTGCDGCMELWETIAQVTQLQDEREELVGAFNKLGNMLREHLESDVKAKARWVKPREAQGQAVEITIKVS